jgi:hypothetical protein
LLAQPLGTRAPAWHLDRLTLVTWLEFTCATLRRIQAFIQDELSLTSCISSVFFKICKHLDTGCVSADSKR